MEWWHVLVFITFVHVYNAETLKWTASNFPNPTASDFKRCKMMSSAQICDPDEVLQRGQRYHINHELHQLESRTRQAGGHDFCDKKGITAAMAVMKHVGDGSEQAVKDLANEILRRWTLDEQCQKSVVYVVAIEDRRFWVARNDKVPVYANEFSQIFNDQKHLFKEGKYEQGLGNAVKETAEIATSKQSGGGFVAPAGGDADGPVRDRKPFIPSEPKDHGHGGGGGKGALSLLSKLPMWFWIALVLVLIPILCCGCICYCCFCRKGGDASPRRQEPSDIAGEQGHGSGGRGGGLNGILSGLGGAGVGHIISRLMQGGGRSGFRRTPQDQTNQGGGIFRDQDGKGQRSGNVRGQAGGASQGFYPSAVVRDEGGGGQW